MRKFPRFQHNLNSLVYKRKRKNSTHPNS
jgi:hypothetical protein